MSFLEVLINNSWIKVLIIVIVLDTILGILRSIEEKATNSTIGIDGIIRKVAMVFCIFFLSLVDFVVHIDLIGFIPDELKQFFNLGNVGIADLFNMLFVIFEFLSIMKNAILCKLPIPKKLQEFLEKIMNEFTGEIKENVKIINADKVNVEQVNNVEIKKDGE